MFSIRLTTVTAISVVLCILGLLAIGKVSAQEYTKQAVGDWIHAKLTAALEERGTYQDNVWTTLEVSDVDFEVKHLQYRDLEFKYNFATGKNLTEADRLNGALWDCEVSVYGGYRRFAPTSGKYKPWSNNPDQIRFYARQVKDFGVIWYYNGTPHTRNAVSTTVERDFFDSLLNKFMRPDSSPTQIKNNHEIRSLLLNDKHCGALASIITLGKALDGQSSLRHREVAAIMESFSLDGCEPDIAMAYKKHTTAWKTNNAKDIQSTFDAILRAARKRRIGVMEYLNPKDEPYGPL